MDPLKELDLWFIRRPGIKLIVMEDVKKGQRIFSPRQAHQHSVSITNHLELLHSLQTKGTFIISRAVTIFLLTEVYFLSKCVDFSRLLTGLTFCA